MATQSTPLPGTLSATQVSSITPLDANTYFANEAIQNMYAPWAAQQTHDNAVAWQNAVLAAQTQGTPAPKSYIQVSVDTALVLALYTGAPTGTNAAGQPKSWADIFVYSQFIPSSLPALTPATPASLVGGVNSKYYAAADGTIKPEGSPIIQ